MSGQLFFASTESFIDYFKGQKIEHNQIVVDFTNCKVWDDSAIGALMKVKDQLKANQITVSYVQMDASSKQLMKKLTGTALD